MIDQNALLKQAETARKNAYAPYSGFTVGAALLCRDGTVYTGCNVENASFSPTCCAERVAIFKAISEGRQDLCAIAVVGGKNGDALTPCPPCGVCRQVLSEFCEEDFPVILANGNGDPTVTTLGALLPYRFRISHPSFETENPS
ncbi:MAG: cytidine deaminase [Clostridia bacterium]|nr:cytidine deaminase [Clostridia bacterium]